MLIPFSWSSDVSTLLCACSLVQSTNTCFPGPLQNLEDRQLATFTVSLGILLGLELTDSSCAHLRARPPPAPVSVWMTWKVKFFSFQQFTRLLFLLISRGGGLTNLFKLETVLLWNISKPEKKTMAISFPTWLKQINMVLTYMFENHFSYLPRFLPAYHLP